MRLKRVVMFVATLFFTIAIYADGYTSCSQCGSINEYGDCPTTTVVGQTGWNQCGGGYTDCHDGTQGPCAPHCHVGQPCTVCTDDNHNYVCDCDEECEWPRFMDWNCNCSCVDVNQNGICDFGPDEDDESIKEPAPGSPLMIAPNAEDWKDGTALRGTAFDLNADGVKEAITWVRSVSGLFFLAIDSDGDGQITSGLELFGDARHPNGFEKLKEYDADGDGYITRRDFVWSQLKLWYDVDADGVTDNGELTALSSTDIVSLGVKYKERQKESSEGDWYRYQGEILRQKSSKKPVVAEKYYDVYFRRHIQLN